VFYGNTSIQHTQPEDPEILSFKVDFHDEAKDTAWTRHGLNGIRRNGELIDVDQYLLHFFRDEALGFIERHQAQPFMLYFAMNSPVPPLQVPRSYFERLRDRIPNIHQRAYNGLVLAQDDAIGAVLDKLRELGLEQDTLVVFVSDNGCAESRPGSNAPYSGGKYTTYEGGIRMPFVMKWPGRLQPGQVYEEPVSTLDILPTAAAACGVPVSQAQPLDGVNLLPYLSQEKTGAPHEALFWKLGGYAAARVGRWKLYMEPKKGIECLYDLLDDPQETTDLKARHPEVFADLKARYDGWNASLPPRAWTNISPVFKK
jgi:arylsulfatase A-like enzyme